MSEPTTERVSTIGDGLFYTVMSFVLVGAIGLGIGFAYAEFYGAGWNGGLMVAGIVAVIAGTILAIAMSGKPLPPPNSVKIEVPPAPTVPRSAHEPQMPTAHELGVSVGATVQSAVETVKERVQATVEAVSGSGGTAEAEPAPPAAPAGEKRGTKPPTLAAPREGGGDDLKRIRGIGPKLEEMLHGLGYYHFDQIAAWSDDEIAWVDTHLEGFSGRATRDDWVGQARQLAKGGETEFSKRVDDGEVY